MSKVMLIGLGDLGGVVLDLLAREDDITEIVVGARNLDRAGARCNLSTMSAVAGGHIPNIKLVRADLNEPEQVAEAIVRQQPDVLLSTATMLSWWAPGLLPPEPAAALKKARFAAWLPAHLAPSINFMNAVRMAQYSGATLIASFPDAVNPVLGKLGLAPTCGVGNIDEIAAKVRWLAARKLGVSLGQITVRLVAHHALEPLVFAERDLRRQASPYLLQIEHDGCDVTQAVAADELLFSPFPLTSGRITHTFTASSAVALVRALLGDREVLTHVPGPQGLPGGYPVRVSRGRVWMNTSPFTMEEAVATNVRAQAYDGVEAILDDGTVLVEEESAAVLKSELGIDVRKITPATVDEQATELVFRFNQLAARHGVKTLQN